MQYTPQDYTDMVIAYGLAGECALRAEEIYAERHPGRRHPSRRTIQRVVNKLRETGCLVHLKKDIPARRQVRNEERILELFDNEPNTSIRRAAHELNMSRYEVHCTLQNNLLHPYHYQRVQQLLPRDFEQRIYFCQGFLAQYRRDATFPDIILWTDECTFTQNGMFNSRNHVYWSDENPHVVRQGVFQYRWSINVWAGVIGNQIIGPYFLPPRLTGPIYRRFIESKLPILLDDAPLAIRQQAIYQHDGAPAHSSRAVREILNIRFPDRWIGRGGPIAWPARSLDLTVLNYFIWGHVKNLVENSRNKTENEVREAIITAFQEIDRDMVRRATRDIVRRAELCLQQRGGHFEQL